MLFGILESNWALMDSLPLPFNGHEIFWDYAQVVGYISMTSNYLKGLLWEAYERHAQT